MFNTSMNLISHTHTHTHTVNITIQKAIQISDGKGGNCKT